MLKGELFVISVLLPGPSPSVSKALSPTPEIVLPIEYREPSWESFPDFGVANVAGVNAILLLPLSGVVFCVPKLADPKLDWDDARMFRMLCRRFIMVMPLFRGMGVGVGDIGCPDAGEFNGDSPLVPVNVVQLLAMAVLPNCCRICWILMGSYGDRAHAPISVAFS